MTFRKEIIVYFTLSAYWLLIIVLNTGCGDRGCMVADVVTPVREDKAFAKGYNLALVTTGMQDKVITVSLFKNNVKFDDCGRSNISA